MASTSVRRLSLGSSAVGYIGWTGRGNLGDEAMYEAARRLIQDATVEVFSGARREAVLAGLGLSGPSRFSSIFLGGGTLINHGYLGVVQRALNLGLPVCTLGTGVGSSGYGSGDETVSDAWKAALNRMDRVGVRGPRSAAKLRALGVEKAEVVGDLALALAPNQAADPGKADGFILNAARPSDQRQDAEATKAALEAISVAAKALARLGLKPIPVAFCSEDLDPIEAILERAELSGYVIAQPASADAFFSIVRGARLTVAIRLHAAVLSCCAGVPPLAIAYREKGHDFAESLGAPEIMVSPSSLDASAFAERARELASNCEASGARLHAASLKAKRALEAYVGHG